MDVFASIKEQLRIAEEKLNKGSKLPVIEEVSIVEEPPVSELELDLEKALHYRAIVEEKLAQELRERNTSEAKMQQMMEEYSSKLKSMEDKKKELEQQLDDLLHQQSENRQHQVEVKGVVKLQQSFSDIDFVASKSNTQEEVFSTSRLSDVYQDQIKLHQTLQQLEDSVRKRDLLLATAHDEPVSDNSTTDSEVETPRSPEYSKSLAFTTPGPVRAFTFADFEEDESDASSLSVQFREFRATLTKPLAVEDLSREETKTKIDEEKSPVKMSRKYDVNEMKSKHKHLTIETQCMAIQLVLDPACSDHDKLDDLRLELKSLQKVLSQTVTN